MTNEMVRPTYLIVLLVRVIITSQDIALEVSLLFNSDVV